MRRQGNKLSTLQIAKMKKPGRYGDGHGLWLQIGPSGSKSWCFCYKRHGRQHVMGLGPLHSVSLGAGARQSAGGSGNSSRRQGPDRGQAPSRAGSRRSSSSRSMTFRRGCARLPADIKIETSRTTSTGSNGARRWSSTPSPSSATCPCSRSTRRIVLKALLPVWKRTPETGSQAARPDRAGDRLGKAARPVHRREPGDRDLLKDHLPAKQKVEHHKAMPYADVPAFMQELRERDRCRRGRSNSPS